MGLLRSKALSLLYCCPRCPILTAFAQRYIQLTTGYDEVVEPDYRSNQQYRERLRYAEQLAEQLEIGIVPQDRIDFEDLYGIGVEEQLCIEEEIGDLGLGPITAPRLLSLFDACPTYSLFWERCVGFPSQLL